MAPKRESIREETTRLAYMDNTGESTMHRSRDLLNYGTHTGTLSHDGRVYRWYWPVLQSGRLATEIDLSLLRTKRMRCCSVDVSCIRLWGGANTLWPGVMKIVGIVT